MVARGVRDAEVASSSLAIPTNIMKRLHAIFEGSVQGVGFRYLSRDIAIKLGITGFIKNLDDGKVEIIAEAEDKTLQEFLEKIRQTFSENIKKEDIQWLEPSSKFKDFTIKF